MSSLLSASLLALATLASPQSLLSDSSTADASSTDPSSPDFDWCTYDGPLQAPAAANNQCFFHYQPSVAGCYFAMVVFSILTIVHLVLNVRYWRYRVMWWVTATALMEIGGYAVRYMITQSNVNNGILVMTVFLVIAPNLFALVNYVMLGRVISATIDTTKVLPPHPRPSLRWLIRADGVLQPRFVSSFFLCSDLASLVLQSIAAAYLTSTDPDDWLTGQHIMTGGLAIPLFFFTVYCVMLVIVYTNARYGIQGAHGPRLSATRAVMWGLLSTSVPLYLRNVYRFLEYAIGTDGWVSTHEWMFYVFDFVCVVVALSCYAAFYFGKHMPLCEQELAVLHTAEAGGEGKAGKVKAVGVDTELTTVQVQPVSDSESPTTH